MAAAFALQIALQIRKDRNGFDSDILGVISFDILRGALVADKQS